MTQVLQLLTVVGVGIGLASYGLIQGRRERQSNVFDPRQQSLFPQSAQPARDRELAAG